MCFLKGQNSFCCLFKAGVRIRIRFSKFVWIRIRVQNLVGSGFSFDIRILILFLKFGWIRILFVKFGRIRIRISKFGWSRIRVSKFCSIQILFSKFCWIRIKNLVESGSGIEIYKSSKIKLYLQYWQKLRINISIILTPYIDRKKKLRVNLIRTTLGRIRVISWVEVGSGSWSTNSGSATLV